MREISAKSGRTSTFSQLFHTMISRISTGKTARSKGHAMLLRPIDSSKLGALASTQQMPQSKVNGPELFEFLALTQNYLLE
jgi:hypothetical protein